MKTIAALLVACAWILTPAGGGAGEETHRRALETLLRMFNMEERAQQSVDQMVALHVQQDPRLGPHTGILRDFYAKNMRWENLKEELIAIYMEEFSEVEVRELIAFYKTPTGKKAVTKMPLLMEKCARIGNRRLMENMGEWNKMLQEETERLRESQGEGGESGSVSRGEEGQR